ncbi:Uncharacterised protein [Candidatus Norongarragalina meridionalis]|nr:Uncharacterised protein [Candidatus Norongarragalina meridionalis]
MEFSKAAIASLLLGVIVLAASKVLWFSQHGLYVLVTTAVVGGALWFGALLIILGLLMIFA